MKYDVILADPPWAFEVWNKDTGAGRSAESHYPTMSTQDICQLPIPAADNCALFLWSCWPTLPDALDVVSAWGFTYKTIAWVWVKAKESGMGFFTGMGYYTRGNTEPCLLAVRGRMPVDDHAIQSLIYSPVREHSRKPDEQYAKIDRLYPNTRRLELFARRRREGWDAFGNEVENSIALEV